MQFLGIVDMCLFVMTFKESQNDSFLANNATYSNLNKYADAVWL